MLRSSLFWVASAWDLARFSRHFVPQNTVTDCGVACAMTVQRMLGGDPDAVMASQTLDPDRAGTNLEELRAYLAESGGLNARALSVQPARLGDIDRPAILHMTRMHYVVLLRSGCPGALVYDPSVGPVFYPEPDFARLFSGYLVEAHRGSRSRVRPRLHRDRPDRAQRAGLFLLGVAARLFAIAVILALCFGLFLLTNKASTGAVLGTLAVVGFAGLLLILARRLRIAAQDALVRRRQSRLWRRMLWSVARGRDLVGFRNQKERDVAARLRQALILAIPKRAPVPATLGAMVVMAGVLALLSPVLAVLYAGSLVGLTGLSLLAGVSLCRRSVSKDEGRYAPLAGSSYLYGEVAAVSMAGEAAKWTVIGAAGLDMLVQGMPDPVLLFWVLMAMQLVPLDFRSVPVLAQAFVPAQPVSPLIGTEAPLRDRRAETVPTLMARSKKGHLVIEGINPLTDALRHPDLTVREQRLILSEVINQAVAAIPNRDARLAMANPRLFGPGQDVTEADFEALSLAEDVRTGTLLPVTRERAAIEHEPTDPIVRAMKSCGPEDFPVFWDVREQIKIDDLRAHAKRADAKRIGHLSMTRLTVIEAA